MGLDSIIASYSLAIRLVIINVDRKPTSNYCFLFLIASISERRTPTPMKEYPRMRLSPKIIPKTTEDMPSAARFEGLWYCFPLPVSKSATITTRATIEMAIHTGSMNASFSSGY